MKSNGANYTKKEQEIFDLLREASFYLQTYRSIDALNVLHRAEGLMKADVVVGSLKASVYKNLGEANIQMGQLDNAMYFLKQAYDSLAEGNDKAAIAGMMANYYLRGRKTKEALFYADKALIMSTAPELKSMPYRIMGTISLIDGDRQKAIELMNKAAEIAEQTHCLTDLAMTIMDISAIFLEMGMLETALSEVYRAERYVKESRNLDLYIRCSIRRAKILFKMKKDEEAKALIMAIDEQRN